MTTLAPLAQAGNFAFTFFERNNQAVGSRHETTWPAFCDWLETQSKNSAVSKEALPLIKLATFRHNHRSDANIETVYGIEGDYDGGTIQPNIAVELLRAAGIEALVHTTPSSQPDKPRWRVLALLSRSTSPAERRGLVGRLNGVLGGILAPESSTASQPFYVGGLAGGSPVQCWRVEGRPVDTVEGLSAIVQGDQRQPGERQPLGSPTLAAPSFSDATTALNSHDPNSLNRDKWISITSAYKQSVSTLTTPEIAKLTWDIWCTRYDQNNIHENDKQWNSIRATTVGWNALRDNSPARAQLLFGDLSQRQLPTQPLNGEIVVPKDMFDSELFGKVAGSPVSTVLVRHIKDARLAIGFDSFKQLQVKRGPMPWDKISTGFPKIWTDDDDIYLQAWFHLYELKPTMENVKYASRISALRNQFDPVVDYLNSQLWDCKSRLDDLFIRYFKATNVAFARIVGPKFLIGMVARAMQPGCKRDETIVLEGAQGIGKSSALRILATDEYFSDTLPDLHEKDAKHHLHGLWLVEIAELAALRKTEIEEIKKFLTTQKDKFRPAYGRHEIESPRTCVFAATTNDDGYLKDQTGNRRFWPIRCSGGIDVEGLRRDRDQLFAEAVIRYRLGENMWLNASEEQLAQSEQEERREIDPWESGILSFACTMAGMPFTVEQIAMRLNITFEKQNATTNKRISQILKRNGFERRRFSEGTGRVWKYVRAR